MASLVAQSESVARTSLLMILLGMAAAIAVFLSAVGLYGVVSYFVRQRTREIGLRMALGADAGEVTGSVLRQAVTVSFAGVGAGLLGALAVTRLLRSLLFEIHPNDPLTLAAAATVLVTVTAIAAWLPARRAARIDPLVALRE
jgi:putative ABC transport system permease protein